MNAYEGPAELLKMEGVREITVVLLESEQSFSYTGMAGMIRSTRANEMLLLDEFDGREGLEVSFLRENRLDRGDLPKGVCIRGVWGLVRGFLEREREEEERIFRGET